MLNLHFFSPRGKPQPKRHVAKLVGQPNYVSEFTQFIDGFLNEHPEVVESQHRGWNIYWDKNVDFDEWEKIRTDSVPEPPYHYE